MDELAKEFMVQLQTFTTSDYLLKHNCFGNICYKIERKNGKKLFISFEINKNIISKCRNDLTHTFGCSFY